MIDTPETLVADAALDAWEASGLTELALPSGTRVKVLPGSLAALMVNGLFPQPLMDAFFASREATDERDRTSDAKVGLDVMRRSQEVAAAAVKFIWHGEAWQAVTVTVERYSRLPIADQGEIARAALGPEMAEVGLSSLAAFRELPAGDGAGGDGEDVQSAPVEPPRPNRAARRARPRSDARR